MNSAQVYPSRYLKSEELDDDITVTIKKVVLEELESKERGKEEKPVAYFNEVEKGLILNKTNWSSIAKQHGDESDDWVGKTITLTVMEVEAFGDIVSAIRVKPMRKPLPSKVGVVKMAKPAAPLTPDEDEVTEFWKTVKEVGGDRKKAFEFVSRLHGGDYAAATEVLREDPTVI